MSDKQKIKDEFYRLCYSIDESVILEINHHENDVGINNVVVGLEKECFGLLLSDEPDRVVYRLFYINGRNRLTGFLLNIQLDNPNRDELVFIFSSHLAHQFEHLDTLDVFNTFQQQTRMMLEKVDHFTVSSLEMQRFVGMDVTIVAKDVKGIEIIPIVDKVEFYREYFGHRKVVKTDDVENYVYLMLNKRTGLVKIWDKHRSDS